MTDRTLRLVRWGLRVVALGGAIGSVGCTTPEKDKQPFGMTSDLQAKLAAPTKTTAPTPAPTFDPSATGGKGVTAQNSFGRLTPASGTSSPGNFAASLPPPQLGAAPPVSAPVQPGMSYATGPMPESNRTTVPGRAPNQPIQPTGGTTPLPPNKLEPVMSEPPVTRATHEQPLPPVAPNTPKLSTPLPDHDPLPRPVPPQPHVSTNSESLPPIAPPPAAPNNPLAPLPSATDAPIHGIKPPAPLKPADPVRPF
jgi:hypothetical protein